MEKAIIIILGLAVGLVPLAVFISGIYLYFFTPKTPQKWVGFRTHETFKSKEAWDYANKIIGLVFLIMGFLMLSIYIPLLVIVYPKFNELAIILMSVSAVLIIGSILIVNYKAKKINQKLDK